MKTTNFKVLLLFLLLLLGFSINSFSQTTITIDSLEYFLTNGKASVNKCYKKTGDVTIPKEINWESSVYAVKSIGKYAFRGCTDLTSITIPNSVMFIDNGAFRDCTGLTSITIPSSVTSIGNYSFGGCTVLKEFIVDLNNTSYATIDGVLFNKSLNQLIAYPNRKSNTYIIPTSVTNIGDYAFFDCTSLTSVTIPNGVKSIGEGAFYSCTGLTSVTIPSGVKSIGDYTFEDCTGFTSVIISTSVTSIGNNAFCGCTGLTSVIIPNSVTTIGNDAFCGCTGLTSVTIPTSVTSIGYQVFSGCTGIKEIIVDQNNTIYATIDGVLFDKSLTHLIEYPQGKSGNYTIPNSVTYINYLAFSDCTGLTSVTIPNSVTSIDDMAFYGCTGLKEFIVDPNNTIYASIDGVLFNKSLKNLIKCPSRKSGHYSIPNSVMYIGYLAFCDCTSLTSINIPTSVISIDDGAFDGCTNISEVICMSSIPPTYDYIFDNNTYNNGTLYVPIGSADNYRSTTPWNKFVNIVEKDLTGIKSISNEEKIYTSGRLIIVENDNNITNNIKVYSNDGLLVKSIATDVQHTEIPVNNSGMYIVKTNISSQKVMVK